MKTNRVVVVTGGGSGIGRAVTDKFAQNGDKVFIVGRDTERLNTVAKEYQNVTPVTADITDVTQVETAVKSMLEKEKTVDVLINCAGGIPVKIEDDASLVDANRGWKTVIELNLTGAFNMTQAFLPYITRPGGRIIHTSSTAALAGSSRSVLHAQAYAASKSGLHGYVRTLVDPLSKEGITINIVAPGVVDHTAFFGGMGVPEERKQGYYDTIPLHRLGEPQEIAAGFFYLASDEAGFVTGEILNINGGAVFGR